MADMTYLNCDLEPAPSTMMEDGVELLPAVREPRDRPRVLVADADQLARRALTDSLRAAIGAGNAQALGVGPVLTADR